MSGVKSLPNNHLSQRSRELEERGGRRFQNSSCKIEALMENTTGGKGYTNRRPTTSSNNCHQIRACFGAIKKRFEQQEEEEAPPRKHCTAKVAISLKSRSLCKGLVPMM